MCVIKYDVYRELRGKYGLTPERRRLKRAGRSIFYTQAFIEAPVTVDGLKIEVLRVKDIDYPAVLGSNLLQLVG